MKLCAEESWQLKLFQNWKFYAPESLSKCRNLFGSQSLCRKKVGGWNYFRTGSFTRRKVSIEKNLFETKISSVRKFTTRIIFKVSICAEEKFTMIVISKFGCVEVFVDGN